MVMFKTEIIDRNPNHLSGLKPMMQAKLELTLVEKVSVLLHVAKLELGASGDGVAYGAIQTIPIVVVDFPAIANIALSVDKQLVIKRQVPRTLRHLGRVQWNGDGQRISERVLKSWPSTHLCSNLKRCRSSTLSPSRCGIRAS